MVQAIINISEDTNRVLNVIKAKHGLKDKSGAIDRLAEEYEDLTLDQYCPICDTKEVKPEYVKKLKRISKQHAIKVGTAKDFRKRFDLR